jgi:dCMP deaminase
MTNVEHVIPEPDEYFMGIAVAARKRANCLGSRVGAAIVMKGRILTTGYNGTAEGTPNCLDGGCYRCAHRDKFESGTAYDLCICVHAEQNAIISAARFGVAIEGSTLYTTSRPCFGCTKEILQAKIAEVVYVHEWTPIAKYISEYGRLQSAFQSLRCIKMDDPESEWAVSKPGVKSAEPRIIGGDRRGT